MHGPAAPAWLLVALCASTGAYCLLRMRSRVEEQRRSAGGEALMGFGMAAMAVPAAVLSPPSWTWTVCAAVFGAAGLRALWSARRGGTGHLHHLVGAFAMVHMALAMAAMPAGAMAHHGHDGGGGQAVTGGAAATGLLLVYYAAYVLRAGVQLIPAPAAPVVSGPRVTFAGLGGTGTPWGDRTEVARACRLSMGIGMFAMLLVM
ncbi:DUF5134 domain-containing protein [Streptomyces tsukubensis]|uniref:DUF5134 domain-containing protein n=1 Tax=Streptomyces tsukubensis TaxID=83656 RepID=A0A1V3ZZA1_9ACTN|nr:DUF5134 domain-containing protein [Streptomyces tsukubensis]OON71790.1 DUF5134 domain-containing protein [Streptomyces tsukubensis]QFR97022.1 DUF5134 domain-containing protein [Streptomyces tsukubensis]